MYNVKKQMDLLINEVHQEVIKWEEIVNEESVFISIEKYLFY